MDALDRAQEADTKFRNQAITTHLRRNQKRSFSLKNCIDCENVIPEARRIAVPGCDRCVCCEQKHETLIRR